MTAREGDRLGLIERRIAEALAEHENEHRYEGGPHTSPMVEPYEYSAEDFAEIAAVVAPLLEGAVSLTSDEIKGLRMALRFGVPDPEPDEIRSARVKLEQAQARAEGQPSPAGAFEQSSGGETIEEAQARQLRGEHAFGPHPGTNAYRGEEQT